MLKYEKEFFDRTSHKILIWSMLERYFTNMFRLWRILEAIDNSNTTGLNCSGIDKLCDSSRYLFKEEKHETQVKR